MSTPIDSSPPDGFGLSPDEQAWTPPPPPPSSLTEETVISPDNPPYGLWAAFGVWAASLVLMVVVTSLVAAIYMGIYVAWRYGVADFARLQEVLRTEQSELIFASVLGIVPAHLLTLLVVWAVVTRFGRHPFWSTLGWSFSARMGLAASAGLSVVMLALGAFLTWSIGGDETDLDQIIASSMKARFATAFLATFTAPIVEEMVYRGVLYPALQRRVGAIWAIVGVSALFASVHLYQYKQNLGVIAVIGLLSVVLTCVRAYSGRLLPCFTIHFIFNGVQAVLLILQPYILPMIERGQQRPQQAAIFYRAARSLIFW